MNRGQILTVTGAAVEADGIVWVPIADPANPALVGFVAADFLEASDANGP